MRPGPDGARRAVVGAIAALVFAAVPVAATAQDARSGEVQQAARDWLALIDKDDSAASWSAAGAKFRAATPASGWGMALKQVRDPLGAVSARAVESTRFMQSIPDYPPGDYAMVVFRTSFARRAFGHETVTLERESGGAWRVVGYLIA